jgi:4-hydroxy-tetrahydrodipicolinate synthase
MQDSNGLKGVIPAVFTPFDEHGGIHYSVLERQVDYLASSGVHGFFVGGTTAEGAFLTTKQKRTLFEIIREVSAGRQFLCLACLRPSTALVADEMHELEDLQPHFRVAVTPFYGTVSQDTIISHYRMLAAASEIPLILYNIPIRTFNPMSLDTISCLSAEQNIVGIKDSSGDFTQFSRGLLEHEHNDFAWIQGEDLLDAPSFLLGCDGIVTGLGNVRIEYYLEMYNAVQENDVKAVINCQQKINRLYDIIYACNGKAIEAVKAGAAYYGRGSTGMITKSVGLSSVELKELEKILETID